MRPALLRATGFALAAVGGALLFVASLIGAILASLPLAALIAGVWIIYAASGAGRQARARIREAIRQTRPDPTTAPARDRKVVPFGRRA